MEDAYDISKTFLNPLKWANRIDETNLTAYNGEEKVIGEKNKW